MRVLQGHVIDVMLPRKHLVQGTLVLSGHAFERMSSARVFTQTSEQASRQMRCSHKCCCLLCVVTRWSIPEKPFLVQYASTYPCGLHLGLSETRLSPPASDPANVFRSRFYCHERMRLSLALTIAFGITWRGEGADRNASGRAAIAGARPPGHTTAEAWWEVPPRTSPGLPEAPSTSSSGCFFPSRSLRRPHLLGHCRVRMREMLSPLARSL